MKLFSDLGIDFIIDFVPVRGDFVKILSESPVLYVKKRGNRQIDWAERQLNDMLPQDKYDITVNTFTNTPEECADKIIALLNYPDKFTSFKNLMV
ncbi:MAG: chloramphenicol phosphotransferase CPT family protein [Clostridiales bacterium]|nr:chloramphenicol phosphotransferase CPT family protein [Clostridiales bacterium]